MGIDVVTPVQWSGSEVFTIDGTQYTITSQENAAALKMQGKLIDSITRLAIEVSK